MKIAPRLRPKGSGKIRLFQIPFQPSPLPRPKNTYRQPRDGLLFRLIYRQKRLKIRVHLKGKERMQYEELYRESNEMAKERLELVMERIAEIAKETDVPAEYDAYFRKTAEYLLLLAELI